jgi:hypothetical protein
MHKPFSSEKAGTLECISIFIGKGGDVGTHKHFFIGKGGDVETYQHQKRKKLFHRRTVAVKLGLLRVRISSHLLKSLLTH